MIREVAHARPDAITVFCTNLRDAAVVEAMEAETSIRVYDTVATAVWKGMRLACVDPSRIGGWGRLFSEVR
jgi:maleate isomerase